MDLTSITEKLSDRSNIDEQYIKEASSYIVSQIRAGKLAILSLVKGLNSLLTNGSHDLRLKGVRLLSDVIISLDSSTLSTKEIEVLCEFICLRLVDHKSMEQPALKCLSYFVDCKNKPYRFNKTLLEFLKTKTNVQKMDRGNRKLVYEVTKKVIIEYRSENETIDSDLLYSLVHMIEGENNPENLLVCFNLVSYVMKNFKDLEPYIDDLFEWLASYYPIDYTPDERDAASSFKVSRRELVDAHYDCFYANPMNAANLQTLLLEKLESNLTSSKIESLNCLIKCYELFPLESIKDYASSLWTCIRMDCLKRISLIDPCLLETSYKTLSALSKKLAGDSERYFTFISDIYEELSIAFRKPEMELFEPAIRLLVNAARPKIVGFNYILGKVIPITLNALKDKELRPLSGLAYTFDQLFIEHPDSTLSSELDGLLNKLVVSVIENAVIDQNALNLLKAMVRCKISIDTSVLNSLIDKLSKRPENLESDTEELLALICLRYERFDIILDATSEKLNLSSLAKSMTFFTKSLTGTEAQESTCKSEVAIKFSIYLRLMILLLNSSDPDQIGNLEQDVLSKFMLELRNIAPQMKNDHKLIEKIGRLHGIVLNKIQQQNVDQSVMNLFSSKYCQNLIPRSKDEAETSNLVYLPVIQWSLKALVLRNSQFSSPMMNLVLNFISSDKVDDNSALLAAKVFKFVISEDLMFSREHGYEVFSLYRQKFYLQTSKEIQIRYNDSKKPEVKRQLLLSALALQISHLPVTVIKKNFEWLVREILKVLTCLKDCKDASDKSTSGSIINVMYECLESLIKSDESGNLLGLLGTLVNLNLLFAQEAKQLAVRKQALDCLAKIASSFKESELLQLRQTVIVKLKLCLSDKKRIVRQAAAVARLRWVLVGQPVGS